MKLLLLFPPQWVPYQPHLALPSLAAFLKANGVDVVQEDLNLESYEYFLTRKYLRALKPRLEDMFRFLDARPQLSPGVETRLYADLFLARSSVNFVADAVEEAKSVFRSSKYFDANGLSKARKTVENALALVSAAHYPSRLDLMSFAMPHYDGTLERIEELTVERIQNPYIEFFEKSILADLGTDPPDVIGISVAGESQLLPALTLSRLLKQRLPAAHIVLGGYLVTLLATVFKNKPDFFVQYFDSLIILEGERPMLALVRAIEGGKSLENVPNLIWRDGEAIRENPSSPPVPMADLPPPDFDGLPLENYLAPEPVLPVLASRGCYWGKCAFCSHNVSYKNKYRAAAGEKIVADLEALRRKYGVRHFAFSDEAIAPKVMRELTATLIQKKADFRFSTNIRMEPQFTPELCKGMHAAGCRVVYIGLESGCDRVLGLMNKGASRSQALTVCRNLVEAGIWDHLYVFFGFPGERQDEAVETENFLLDNAGAIKSFNVGSFSLTRGSTVLAAPEEYGVRLPHGDANNDLSVGFAYEVTSGLGRKQAVEYSAGAWARLTKVFPTRDILGLISKEDLLLYLAHFESDDPTLSRIKPVNATAPQSHKLTGASQPKLAAAVVKRSISYDLPSILKGMASVNNEIKPSPTRVLFNPTNGRLRSIGANISEVLDLCNGNRTVQVIARRLAKKYGASDAAVEAFCLDSLSQLAVEGYVTA